MLALGSLAALAWLTWPLLFAWNEEQWVARVVERIEAAEAAQLPPLMDQLASSSDAGRDELVALVAHPRPEVRAQAAERLGQLLDQWQSAPAPVGSRQVAQVANGLAENAALKQAPRELVVRLLDWPVDTSAIDASQFLRDCQALTERSGPRVVKLAEVPKRQLRSAPQAPAAPAVSAEPEPIEEEAPRSLPMQEVAIEQAPAPLEALQAPDRLQPELPLSDEGRAKPIPTSEPPARLIEPSGSQPLNDWDGRTDQEVMRELHADNEEQVRAAARELRRRGYESHHLAIARSLTHPDPAVRRDLAAALPRLPGIDWRRWITPLLSDDDPSVRTAAEAVIHAGEKPRRLR
jgi:hypothetical protein